MRGVKQAERIGSSEVTGDGVEGAAKNRCERITDFRSDFSPVIFSHLMNICGRQGLLMVPALEKREVLSSVEDF